MITREFDLMLYQEGNLLFINANQYDSGEQWIFTLYEEDGTKYTPATGAIVGVKSDGKGIINTGTVDEYGRVVINETQQMTAAAGLATFELLIDNDTHGTANFKVDVEPRPADNADLSDSDLSLIQQAVDSAAEIEDLLDGQDVPTVITPIITDWLDDNITNPSNPPIDTSLTVAGAAADAKATGHEIADLKSALQMETSETLNYIDTSAITEGYQYNWQGNFVAASNRNTTNYIPVKKGDVLWFFTTVNNDGQTLVRVNCERLVEFDANKNRVTLSGQYPFAQTTTPNGNSVYQYTIQHDDAAYVRISYNNTYSYPSLYINAPDITYTEYVPYAPSYVYSKVIEGLTWVSTNIIECWGDSRIAMKNDGTSMTDYLQTLIGNSVVVCNYGISSQSSGNCAMRLGANEVFVSVANNTIPASGEVALTAIKSYPSDQVSVYAFSATATSPCILGGVRGKLNRSSIGTMSNNTFIRDTAGEAVTIRPYSKVLVDDMNSKHHICVFWWGKNDYSQYQSSTPNTQILDNYAAAVKYINHDYYVILGETCSLTSDYETGGTKRTFLDTLNAELADLYPQNYIDINAWLSSVDALTAVGLTPTTTDTEYIAKGWPCYQLMEYSTSTSDTVHPNEKGREAIAYKVHQWMTAKGWI